MPLRPLLVGNPLSIEDVLSTATIDAGCKVPIFNDRFPEKVLINTRYNPKSDLFELACTLKVKLEIDDSHAAYFTRVPVTRPTVVPLDNIHLGFLRGLPERPAWGHPIPLYRVIQMLADAAHEEYIIFASDLTDLIEMHGTLSPWLGIEKLCEQHGVTITKTKLGWVFMRRR